MDKAIYLIIISLLTILLIEQGYPDYIDISFTGIILIVDLVSLLVFLFRREENAHLKKQFLKISNLFVLSFIIVHFQMYIDIVLGYISDANGSLLINNRIALKSLLISSIAFNAFCLGYVLITHKAKKKQEFSPKNKLLLNSKILFFVAIFFLLMYFSPIGDSWALLFECAVFALLIIKAQNLIVSKGFGVSLKKTLFYFKEEIVLLTIYCTYLIVTGERGIVIHITLFFIGTLLYVTKLKFGRISILLFVGVASVSLTLLGVARKFKEESSFLEKIKVAMSDESESYYYPDSFLSSTKELASSGRILNIAVNEIEQGGNYTYGLFALQDLMLLIPSLKGTAIDTFDIPYFLTSSPQYFTYIDLGSNPAWGVGTSCVADTYTDFGLIGVILIFLLFGLLTRKLEIVMHRTELANFVVLTISILVFSYSIYISRATLLYSVTSKLTYIVIFVYTITLLSKAKIR